MQMRTVTILLLLTAVLRVGHAQSFWQGTSYGDSVSVVQAKISGISEPKRSDELSASGIEVL